MPEERALNAADWFVDRSMREGRGDRTAIVHDAAEGARTFTYRDVLDGVNRAGNALRALGVRASERVALLLVDGPAFVSAFWGAIKIGAVPVPMSTMVAPTDYAFMLDDCGARTAIVSGELVDRIDAARAQCPRLEHVIIDGGPHASDLELDALLAAASSELAAAPTMRDDWAFWLYTSGTTGKPKAAMHRQRDMLACVDAFGRHVLDISASDRCLSVAKLFFAYGLGNALYFPFAVGATSILHPKRFDAESCFALIARERPTLFFAVPTAYAALLRVPDAEHRFDLGSVRRCLSAGEALPAAIGKRWRARFGVEILDGIGSTEMCHTFIANRAGAVRHGSSGTVVPGYRARIIGANGDEVADGEVGDLIVTGESAFAGYWNRAERTAETIVDGWVRTGDRYSRDADGYFWHAGRTDDMIKAGGLWVSPTEVEGALLEHAAVAEAAVVGAADANALVKPIAFVVLAAGRAPSDALEAELKDWVKAKLAPYKHPRHVHFVDALPKTATGKVQRFKLRERGAGTRG